MALYGLAMVVRALLFALHPDAAYPDSYYYADVARSLQAGHGFNVDFIYSFIDVGGRIPSHPGLPIPSNAFWMPLASIVQLPSMWLLGPSPLASAIPFALIGSLAAPLTWLIAREMGCRPRVALAAGIGVAIPAGASIFMAQPDNFSLFQVLGTAAIWFTVRGLAGHRWSFALAGVMVGLATLSRNDGLLLGGVVGLAFVWDRRRAWRSKGTRAPAIPWRYAVACFGLFVLVVAPWYLRQLAVFGTILPSSATGQTLFQAACFGFAAFLANFGGGILYAVAGPLGVFGVGGVCAIAGGLVGFVVLPGLGDAAAQAPGIAGEPAVEPALVAAVPAADAALPPSAPARP